MSPLAVGCTRCGANSGVSCETRSERFLRTFHKARHDLAAAWTEDCCRNCNAYVDAMGCDTAITRFRNGDVVEEWTWCSEQCLDEWCAKIRAARTAP